MARRVWEEGRLLYSNDYYYYNYDNDYYKNVLPCTLTVTNEKAYFLIEKTMIFGERKSQDTVGGSLDTSKYIAMMAIYPWNADETVHMLRYVLVAL